MMEMQNKYPEKESFMTKEPVGQFYCRIQTLDYSLGNLSSVHPLSVYKFDILLFEIFCTANLSSSKSNKLTPAISLLMVVRWSLLIDGCLPIRSYVHPPQTEYDWGGDKFVSDKDYPRAWLFWSVLSKRRPFFQRNLSCALSPINICRRWWKQVN